MIKTVIASDGSGLNLKEAVKKHLIDLGMEVEDAGQQVGGPPVTHIAAARNLVAAMRKDKLAKGVIICGTGAGVSICVNKFKGMYCVACESVYTAPKIALINNANVLAMGGRVLGPENACEMAEKFLRQEFAEGFAPQRRETVEKMYGDMQQLEAENF